jgi:hypothetical protein
MAFFATGGAVITIAAARGMATEETASREIIMDIKRSGSEASRKGSADWFTGSVRVDPLFQVPEPARVSGGHVTFEPGARTAWHTHPLGQTLIITSGLGWGSMKADQSRKYVRAMSSGSRPARSIGMAAQPPRL